MSLTLPCWPYIKIDLSIGSHAQFSFLYHQVRMIKDTWILLWLSVCLQFEPCDHNIKLANRLTYMSNGYWVVLWVLPLALTVALDHVCCEHWCFWNRSCLCNKYLFIDRFSFTSILLYTYNCWVFTVWTWNECLGKLLQNY